MIGVLEMHTMGRQASRNRGDYACKTNYRLECKIRKSAEKGLP